jgi:hypothetical protein
MHKRETLEDFQVFYMELPKADYMDDIVIQDAYDNAMPGKIRGLSVHQVSEIARDSLDAATRQQHKPTRTHGQDHKQ